MFNESLAHRELCDAMKSTVTRLLHKKDDRRNLKNWRPISLLNVDYKICSKAFSLRLKKVLGSIVDPDQTCSVPGRSIFFFFFLTALLAFYSVTIVINEKLHVHNYEGKK